MSKLIQDLSLSTMRVSGKKNTKDSNFDILTTYTKKFTDILPKKLCKEFTMVRRDTGLTNITVLNTTRIYAPITKNSKDAITLPMQRLNNNLYTETNAKDEATYKQLIFENDFMSDNPAFGFNPNKKPGFIKRTYTGNYNGDVGFINDSLIQADSIENNIVLNTTLTTPYSVEFHGYFVPDSTGQWKFDITKSTDIYSGFWIGDNALYVYNKDNTTDTTSGIQLYKDIPYKIRIIIGVSTNNPQYNVAVKNPQGNSIVLSNYIFNVPADKEKDVFYYALVSPKSDQTDLFMYSITTRQSVIVNGQNTSVKQLLKRGNDYTNNPIFSRANDAGSYLKNDGVTGLIMNNDKTNTQTIILNFNDSQVEKLFKQKDDPTTTADDSVIRKQLMDSVKTIYFDGDLIDGNNRNFTNVKRRHTHAKPNDQLKKIYDYYKGNGKDLSIIAPSDTLNPFNHNYSMAGLDNYIRISPDYKYILFVDTRGTLQICETFYANNDDFIKSNKNSIITENDSFVFRPLSIQTHNSNLAETPYLVNTKTNTYNAIDPNESLALGYTQIYKPYNGVPPENLTNTQSLNANECKKTCDKDVNCKYYYTYKSGNDDKCTIGKYTDSEPSFSSTSVNPAISNSKLYIKTNNIETKENTSVKQLDPKTLSPSNLLHYINTGMISDFTNYSKDPNLTITSAYETLIRAYGDAKELASRLLDRSSKKYAKTSTTNVNSALKLTLTDIENDNTYLKDQFVEKMKEIEKIEAFLVKEGFKTDLRSVDGRAAGTFTNCNIGDGPENNAAVANSDIRKRINSKQSCADKMEDQYNDSLDDIKENRSAIATKAAALSTKVTQMMQKSNEPNDPNRKYDFNNINKNDKILNNLDSTILDAALDDINHMIFYQNTTYIITTLFLSFMIISFITMSK